MVDFSHNLLTSASPLSSLSSFVSINLGHNQLTTLPAWDWEALEHLTALAAPNNALQSLPAGMGCLQMLVSLDLCHNQITQVRG